MLNKKIAVIGGDFRQAVVAELLAEKGAEVAVFALEKENASISGATLAADLAGALCNASAVILPLPVSRDGKCVNTPLSSYVIELADLVSCLSPETAVIGGMLDFELFKGYKCFDYYEMEDFKLLNAVPTAEGAIAIAMDSLKTTLHGSKALILGCGRIGKVLAKDLSALGTLVTLAVRKDEQRAWCEINGFKTADYGELESLISEFDVIFNTVPCVIIKESILDAVKNQTPIIDLASKPFGVDYAVAKELGKTVIIAQSLPGKVAPISAGRIISHSVCNVLRKERIL